MSPPSSLLGNLRLLSGRCTWGKCVTRRGCGASQEWLAGALVLVAATWVGIALGRRGLHRTPRGDPVPAAPGKLNAPPPTPGQRHRNPGRPSSTCSASVGRDSLPPYLEARTQLRAPPLSPSWSLIPGLGWPTSPGWPSGTVGPRTKLSEHSGKWRGTEMRESLSRN